MGFGTKICALLAAAVGALTFAAVASASLAPSAIPDCLGKPQVRPATMIFACADANFGIKKLHWIGWGESTAAAVGVAYANDCTPTCAAGHFHNYQAVIVANGMLRCANGTVTYGRVTVAFVGPSPYPKGKPADFVYPLRCA